MPGDPEFFPMPEGGDATRCAQSGPLPFIESDTVTIPAAELAALRADAEQLRETVEEAIADLLAGRDGYFVRHALERSLADIDAARGEAM